MAIAALDQCIPLFILFVSTVRPVAPSVDKQCVTLSSGTSEEREGWRDRQTEREGGREVEIESRGKDRERGKVVFTQSIHTLQFSQPLKQDYMGECR